MNKKNKILSIVFLITISTLISISTSFDILNSKNRIILATTTSTYDSGLLEYLIPSFEEESGILVDILSVGTGYALETGRRGDADVLLVHSRTREDEFVSNGYGIHRACIMYNDFIIVGPSNDPASIQGENTSVAMTNLKSAGELGLIEFYSRGDGSGTNSKELKLWDLINQTPNSGIDGWYYETGAGMGNTLIVADENSGYTLIDRGTWLSTKDSVNLVLLVEGEEVLLNPYGAILVNPEVHLSVKYDLALKFVAFLTSKEGQELIGTYKLNNETLFFPSFGHGNETYGCSTTDTEIEFWREYNGNYIG
ncbi:MAG: substrate-binding domain-containing protein [Promethearchaeota archaeon]|jgi:tungstate transport system substrate-binding protein